LNHFPSLKASYIKIKIKYFGIKSINALRIESKSIIGLMEVEVMSWTAQMVKKGLSHQCG
jgi:hypothetical protein